MYSPKRAKNETDDLVHFENLPDVILFKIFSYLYIGDLCRAGRVCLRWYHLSRCQVLWKYVDTHDMQLTSYQVQKFIQVLPPCVTYLRISSLSTQHRIPFITPHAAIAIRERCPLLQTLILESAFIAKHINFTDITVEDLPQKLSVLSLRKSFFHTDQFFCSVSHPTVPKIKVLDCSSCWCVCDNDIPFFSRLSDLQEIYLPGCPITDGGVVKLLKNITNLKVLDLEHTSVGKETMTSIREYCPSLEKLYLADTVVEDDHLSLLTRGSQPALQVICLKETLVTCISLRYIVSELRTLKHIKVSGNSISEECCLEVTNIAMKQILHVDKHKESREPKYCDHFFLRDNYIKL